MKRLTEALESEVIRAYVYPDLEVVKAAARAVVEGTDIQDFDKMTWGVREHLEMWADVVEQRTEKVSDVRIVLTWVEQLRASVGLSPDGFGPDVSRRLVDVSGLED